MKKSVILLAVSFLCSCGIVTDYTKITRAQLDAVDVGLPPQDNGEKIVRAYMEMSLFDSVSALYKFEGVKKGYVNESLFDGGKVKAFGWCTTVLINAKNRMGAYVGYNKFVFLLKGDQVIARCDMGPRNSGCDPITCANATLDKFESD